MQRSISARTLLLLLIGAALAWLVSGNVFFLRLLYLGLALLLLAWGWGGLLARGLRLQREARSYRASVGDVFAEQFRLQVFTWPGCPWVEVVNESPLPGAGGSRLLARLRFGEQRFYTARTLLTRRGAFPLGPTRLVTYDPFGIFQVEKRFPAEQTLLVLPMTFSIDESALSGVLPPPRPFLVRATDVTPHAAGVREYVPGDPPRRIHWPATARRGQLMVKEFEQEPQADLWLFLDAQQEAHFSRPVEETLFSEEQLLLRRPQVRLPCDTFEYAVSAAASLARYFLQKQRSVGLVCSTTPFVQLWGERGERQLEKILETLTFLSPNGDLPLPEMVSRQARLLSPGAGVILITPRGGTELLLSVETLLRRRLGPVVLLLRAETFGGPAQEIVSVAAVLSGMNVPVCLLAYGDDLGKQLAFPVAHFQDRHRLSSVTVSPLR